MRTVDDDDDEISLTFMLQSLTKTYEEISFTLHVKHYIVAFNPNLCVKVGEKWINGVTVDKHFSCVSSLNCLVMELNAEISDNTISSSTAEKINIDDLITDIDKCKNHFDHHMYEIIRFQNKCDTVIEKLTELKRNNIDPDEEIRKRSYIDFKCDIIIFFFR